MSGDVGSRNRFNNRVKIVSLRSNESNKTVKQSRKIRGDSENGGSGSYKSSGLKDKRISRNGREGSEGMSDMKGGFSGKRVYADRERHVDARLRMKDFSGKRQGLKGDSGVTKTRDQNVASRTMWGSAKLERDGLEDRPSSRKVKNVERSDRVSVVTRVEGMDRRGSLDVDGGKTGLLKRHSKNRSDLSKGFDGSQKKSLDVSPLSLGRKKNRSKKSVGEDLEGVEERPKKKKRVIRLDPYDISNKRIDDGIVDNDVKEAKKQVLEERAEMSMNAKFRAIQPSPSILSYVEDNLLGRRRLIELRRAGYNTELSAPLDNIPHSTSSERERIEENVFRNKLTFFAAAKVSSSFPPPEMPEIAFAGRSNVGKSSLLNALTRQWGVVRTSDKPGLTQTINFFSLGSKLNLVDLPGYGFAYAKEEVKDAWEELVKEYVSTRVGLKRVCLLIDTKWGMKPRDHELIDLMERAETKYQIVLTKTDVVFPIDVARRAMQIEENLKAHKSVVQPVMMVSSQSGAGIRSLRTVLSKIGRFAKF